jgi:hypothetical protein
MRIDLHVDQINVSGLLLVHACDKCGVRSNISMHDEQGQSTKKINYMNKKKTKTTKRAVYKTYYYIYIYIFYNASIIAFQMMLPTLVQWILTIDLFQLYDQLLVKIAKQSMLHKNTNTRNIFQYILHHPIPH